MHSEMYTLFFTGKDDPRQNAIVIGTTTVPIFFRFDTPTVVMGETRTTVYRNNNDVVAWFDWILNVYLGTAHVLGKQMDMSALATPGSDFSGRRFTSADGSVYEWRKEADGYDLLAVATNVRIAEFRRVSMHTPVGLAHAVLHVSFPNELLILEALLSLCVVRWMECQGF